MKLNLENIELCLDPFPYAVVKNFLDEKDLEALIEQFPKNAKSFQNVMGGRFRLSSEEAEFYRFLGVSTVWDDFYTELNNYHFVLEVIKLFEETIPQYNPAGDFKSYKFDKNFLRRGIDKQSIKIQEIARTQVHAVSSKNLIYFVFSRFVRKLSAAFGFFEAKEKKEMYLHLDISEADVGYQREIHHDNDNRIAAMVFYLTDQNDMVGGEFGMHEYKIKRPLSECEPHPAAEQMKATKIFQPARNTLILFLSTPNSYHSVPQITAASASRKFIYGGITTKEKRAWLNAIPTR